MFFNLEKKNDKELHIDNDVNKNAVSLAWFTRSRHTCTHTSTKKTEPPENTQVNREMVPINYIMFFFFFAARFSCCILQNSLEDTSSLPLLSLIIAHAHIQHSKGTEINELPTVCFIFFINK